MYLEGHPANWLAAMKVNYHTFKVASLTYQMHTSTQVLVRARGYWDVLMLGRSPLQPAAAEGASLTQLYTFSKTIPILTFPPTST